MPESPKLGKERLCRGMIFLGIVFFPILAFGSATYQKQEELPAAAA